MERKTARAWAEIDLGALEHNYRILRGHAPGAKFLGVVKANAYGHGAEAVAKKLESLGAEYLAVACLEEGIQLREKGVKAPILILGVTEPEFVPELLRYELTQNVPSLALAKAYSKAAAGPLKVHVKMDTGMGRLGFVGEKAAEEILEAGKLPNLVLEGLFTHFADADGSEAYTRGQLETFTALRDTLAKNGLTFSIVHCAASAAMLHYKETHMDMVRPGIALYGHYPDEERVSLGGEFLKPVMALKSRVMEVRNLKAGSFVSYGRTYELTRDSRVAVLGIGYADGLRRGLSNQMEVGFHSGRAKQIGRICMDICMVDVTDLPEVKAGDEAEIFGEHVSLEDKAAAAGTISYELLTAVAPRVARVYR